jgi:hypothetical protein
VRLALALLIGTGATLWCLRELFLGFRTGQMANMAPFSTRASRAEKPGVFWFNVAMNVFVAAAMVFAICVTVSDPR